MDTAAITVSFIVTILGIAYPILFQVVSRLDEKYSSMLILELFSKEKERKVFKIALITSLIAILIYILKLPPFIEAFCLFSFNISSGGKNGPLDKICHK